ncbi:hypothetical protein ACH42_00930 [Endozoicomonas sp. (ex Bugula neritina AB1)]|nr:hypothetical protein ACH42_00930 [Endozoicomonas sp. (ex Bugula neritina AB1)]
MSRKSLLTLLISIVAHVAAVVAFDQQVEESRTISVGAVRAPVSLSFSSVSQPKPQPAIEQPKPKPEPKPKKTEPPKPEPKVKTKPVLKKPEPVVEKKPEPPKPKPEPKPEPEKKKEEPKPEPPAEPVMEKTAVQESEIDGLSNEPVMVSEPAIRSWKEPRYPKNARRRNQQGVVMLDVVVDEEGNPETINILESSGFSALDKAAIASVERWAFEPEQRNNQLVKSRVHIPVAFRLN